MDASKPNSTAQNAIKLLGETALPGASLLLDGRIVEGGAHFLAGVVAGVALGPIGVALVVANSYSKSTQGKSLLKHLTKETPEPVAVIEKSPATP